MSEINAVVPWYGSKRTMAQKIIAALGKHRAYWEPFCGSCAVLIAKPIASMEVVNDLHADLIHLLRVMQHKVLGPAFYRTARRLICSQQEFSERLAKVRLLEYARQPAPATLDLDRAMDFFVTAWMGRNGTIGSAAGNNFCVRYTANGGSPGKRWHSAAESIPQFRRRFECVVTTNVCGIEMSERVDDADGNALYADAPYLDKTAEYIHDFTSTDHERLAAALCRFKKTRAVVSYYWHPLLPKLYPGWQAIDCTLTKSLVSQGCREKNNKTKAPEFLLVNGPVEGGKPIESFVTSVPNEAGSLFGD